MAKKATGAAKPAAAKTGEKKAGKGPGKGKGSRPPKINSAGPGHNGDRTSDAAIQANFLQHRSIYIRDMAALKVAEKKVRDTIAAAKADGFHKKEFVLADMLTGSAKKEAKVIEDVTVRLRVARWIGHAMGKQYDLFENPPVTVASSTEEAHSAGRQAAGEGDPMTPPPQFSAGDLAQAWLRGYQSVSEDRVRSMKPPEERNGDEPWQGPGDPDGDRPPAGWGDTRQPRAVN